MMLPLEFREMLGDSQLRGAEKYLIRELKGARNSAKTLQVHSSLTSDHMPTNFPFFCKSTN